MSQHLIQKSVDDYYSPADWAEANPRKVEVLKLRADGMRLQEIAAHCGIAKGTAQVLLLRAKHALGARSSHEAIVIAMRLEILQ